MLQEDYDAVVLATGAYPYLQPAQIPQGMRAIDGWEAISAPETVDGPVLVADWGGEWTGLDAAEVLAATGLAVTLEYASAAPGEGVHQYQRNLQLERLDRLSVVPLAAAAAARPGVGADQSDRRTRRAYVALALSLDATLVTTDDRLRKAASGLVAVGDFDATR